MRDYFKSIALMIGLFGLLVAGSVAIPPTEQILDIVLAYAWTICGVVVIGGLAIATCLGLARFGLASPRRFVVGS